MSAGDVEDVYELSPLQQGILFHSLFDGDSRLYVNQRSFLIEGALDPDTLERAWRLTSDAHTALRTSYHWDGLDKPLQVVHRTVRTAFQHHDWSSDARPGVDRDLDPAHDLRLQRFLADDLDAGVDLARPPLQRVHLIRLDDRRSYVVWTHHLLMLDGWSVPVFLNELMARYGALVLGTPMPPAAPPYRDYIAWLQRQDLDAARDFWIDCLGGRSSVTPPSVLLPEDPDRPPSPLGEQGVQLPPAVATALRGLAARHRVTLNTVLQAAWALVLQRYTGDDEVTFGVTSSCRPPELPGIDRMTGLFTNTLPVRVAVPDRGDLGRWLRAVQSRYTQVRRYEYSPLAQIKQWIGAPGLAPLFHSLVVFDNYSLAVELGALGQQVAIRPIEAVEKTSQPLVVIATLQPSFGLTVRYQIDRFRPGGAEEVLRCFEAVLTAMADAETVEAAATAAAEGPAAPPSWGPRVAYQDAAASLPELLRRRCRATPDATAVVADEGLLTYAELIERAGQVAAALSAAGAGPGHVVGVCAERSVDLVVGIVGTTLAGAAYLPLDPSLPSARLAFQRADAGADVVLCQGATVPVAREAGAREILTIADLPRCDAPDAGSGPGPADPAYVMYTSGSTGRPKGVVVTHRAIVNRLLWMQDAFGLGPADRVLQKTPFGFDVSVWEFFWPLLTGAGLVVARPGGHQDAEYLADVIRRYGVTTAHFVPSMLQLFLDEPAASRVTGLQRVVCSGEQLPDPLVRRFRQVLPEVELHNLYGPTEAAVDVTWWDCARPAPPGVVPIGGPIANVQACVLDRRLAEVPTGVPGELYLGGIQLARGYLNRPGLTAATFVAHPLAGEGQRLYHTGDQVRRLPDGSLEFLGRLDHQVKIHGYRIELGEIEEVLAGHPSVREAAVVVRERGERVDLVAHVTGALGAAPDVGELHDHLQRHLPEYMVPSSIAVLPSMPLTPNGKLDRGALRETAAGARGPVAASAPARARTLPATEREQAVAAAFADVLGVPEVDVTTSFFDLGGNSFDAVRAVRRIEGATVGLLGAHPSVRALVEELSRQDDTQRILLRLTDPGQSAYTLVCVPFGGGSAITYQPLARALPADTALYSLSLPGHELGGTPELRPLEDVAREGAEAVLRVTDGPVCVYGHCAGVATAVELTRQLEAAGRRVERLFVGASYPFYEPGPFGRFTQRVLAAMIATQMMRVSARTVGMSTGDHPIVNRAELEYLRSIGGFSGVVDDAELAFIMRAFRHDVVSASRYFSERWHPRREGPRLAAPITFIAGTRDPLTPGYQRRFRLWERVGIDVELLTVDEGGHYFHQEQPDAVRAILDARRPLASIALV